MTERQLRPLEPALHQRLRQLAAERLDAEIFDHLFPSGGTARMGREDLQIVAAVLREAARQFSHHVRFGKPDREIERIAEFVEALLAAGALPDSPRAPHFREYMAASLDWNTALRGTGYEERFWPILLDLLGMELTTLPDLHERLIALAADFGPAFPAFDAVKGVLARFVRRPYLCTDPNSVLVALAGALQGIIGSSDFTPATGRWLALWRYHLGHAKVNRKLERERLLRLRTVVHRRLGLLFRLSGLLSGRHGNLRTTATLLLVKIDLYGFIRTGLVGTPFGKPWLALLCFAFRCLGAQNIVREDQHFRTSPWSGSALRVRASDVLTGSRRDVVVTRAQGGLGDILMMRPGLLALSRRLHRRGGRVVFATNRAFFSVFSTDDPVELLDIEHNEVDVTSFGGWRNLTHCPADTRETREFPRIRTNRIEIFARAIAARLPRLSRDRSCPIRFREDAAARAKRLLLPGARAGRPSVGLQYRSAEAYRDVPALLDAARHLAKRYNVFVFDNRPIPKRPDDEFIAVDDQPLPIVLAMMAEMDAIVAPDSVYVHLAGANNIPCLALFGPTGGKVRTSGYPSVRYLDASDKLACIPCWRNEYVRCAVGRGYQSVCMGLLTAPAIVAAVDDLLGRAVSEPTTTRPSPVPADLTPAAAE